MSVNENERSKRRRIVFHAMNGNATPKAIQYAIQSLETDFADVEDLRYNQFVQRMQENLDSAEVNLGKVLGQIMSIRSLPLEEIGPDPIGDAHGGQSTSGTTNASTPSRSKKTSAIRTGPHQIFATVVEAIVGYLQHRGDDSHLHLIDAIVGSSEVQKFGPRISDAFQLWRSSPQPGELLINGTPDEYRVIVHRVYVWLCQKLGPVDADRTLDAAIRSAETLPEAVNHSPRELL